MPDEFFSAVTMEPFVSGSARGLWQKGPVVDSFRTPTNPNLKKPNLETLIKMDDNQPIFMSTPKEAVE